MIHNIVLFSAACLFVFAFMLVVRAFLIRATRKQEAAEAQLQFGPSASNYINHAHEWRHITEFVKQCRIRTCGAVEFVGEVPDGMMDYVRLMTTRQARIDPKGEAGHYYEMEPRAWGLKCPWCDRVIGDPEGLPNVAARQNYEGLTCPFCQGALIVVSSDYGSGRVSDGPLAPIVYYEKAPKKTIL